MQNVDRDIIVIGAGGCGLMAALVAAKKGEAGRKDNAVELELTAVGHQAGRRDTFDRQARRKNYGY